VSLQPCQKSYRCYGIIPSREQPCSKLPSFSLLQSVCWLFFWCHRSNSRQKIFWRFFSRPNSFPRYSLAARLLRPACASFMTTSQSQNASVDRSHLRLSSTSSAMSVRTSIVCRKLPPHGVVASRRSTSMQSIVHFGSRKLIRSGRGFSFIFPLWQRALALRIRAKALNRFAIVAAVARPMLPLRGRYIVIRTAPCATAYRSRDRAEADGRGADRAQ
jgi:hypothetical protein